MSDNGETSRTHEPYKYEKLFMRTARKTLEELAKEGILDFKTEYSLRANLFRALDQLKTSVKNLEAVRDLQYAYKFSQCLEANRINLENESTLTKNIDELTAQQRNGVFLKTPLVDLDTINCYPVDCPMYNKALLIAKIILDDVYCRL